MKFHINSPNDVQASSGFPVGGYQDGEGELHVFHENKAGFSKALLGNAMHKLAEEGRLYAKTTFTNQRLILEYQESWSTEKLHQVSVDYALIKSAKVGNWYGRYNVSVEIEAPVGTHCFFWSFNRPYFNAALIWFYWYLGVLSHEPSEYLTLEYYQKWLTAINACGTIIIPNDFRQYLNSRNVDVAKCEREIGLRLIDNRSPSVDHTPFIRYGWVPASESSSPAEADRASNQSSSASSATKMYSVSDLCSLTGKSFDTVWAAAKSIGSNTPPFSHFNADQISIHLTGSSIDVFEATPLSSSSIISETPQSIHESSASNYSDIESGELPKFTPSKALVPDGLQYVPEGVDGLKFCLANANAAIQSFFNVLPVAGLDGNEVFLNDDSMLVTPFDELLYCQIVKENHKYALAELYDLREEEAEKRGQRFKKWGTVGAVFLFAPLLPFIAYSQGKASAPKGSRLDEIIPDPQLEFQKDRNSFLAMTQAGGVLPRLRRLIFHKLNGANGVYYRIIPAVITQDFVIPCQVFSFNSNFFLRPVSAGIDSKQDNYDARKIHRQYYHPRLDGISPDTGERILIKGNDIDDQRFKVFQFSSDTRDLTYLYVDYPADPSHVF